MAVTCEFDGTNVVLRLTGSYETADVRAALVAALDDPDAPRAAGMLLDVRASRSIAHRSAADVRAMAQFLAGYADRFGRRLALLAAGDVAFGLMRLGAVSVEQHGVETAVFRNLSDAEEWLAGGNSA